MKISGKMLTLVALAGAALVGLMPLNAFSSALKDADGNLIAPATSTPFSMKVSCGECHSSSKWSKSGGRYERDVASVTKSHNGETYETLAPQHGVTAGYHFQQGRNIPWGDTQRAYYGLPGFTSSPGMLGKY